MRLLAKMKHGFTQSGFTIVELLVVIAIIGVLVSLLFPAIGSVREASRRTSCQNNLRQLGVATQQFTESTGEVLPALWLTDRSRPWQNFSWRVKLLPFLEQQNLLDGLELSSEPLVNPNLRIAQIPVGVFECPSTPTAPRRIQSLGFAESQYDDCLAAASDYTAVYEVRLPSRRMGARGAWNGVNEVDSEFDAMRPDFVSPDQRNPGNRRQPAPLAAVRDGLSNTVLLVEQAGKPNLLGSNIEGLTRQAAEGAWSTAEYSTFFGEGINRNNYQDPFAFHRVVHIVLCDASVHSWAIETEPEIIRALMTADGREIVQSSDWK